MTTQEINDLAKKVKKTTDWYERNRSIDTLPTEFPHQVEDFIRELLNKTSNHSNWISAIKIARTQNLTSTWKVIIFELLKLTKKKTVPNWAYGVLSSISEDVKMEGYDLKHLFKVYFQSDNEYLIFKNIIPKGSYSARDISNAFRDNISYMNKDTMINIVSNILTDWFEITYFLKDISDIIDRRYVVTKLLNTLMLTDRINFLTYFFLDDFMIEFKDLFTTVEIVDNLSYVVKKKFGPKSIDIFVDIVQNSGLSNDIANVVYDRLYKVNQNNENMNSELFKLTNDDKFLPDTVKDVFLF